jgi:hypothetical protein
MVWSRFGLWCLAPLSTIFQLFCGDHFYWWWKPEYPEKTTDPSEVNDELYPQALVSFKKYMPPPPKPEVVVSVSVTEK